MKKGIIVFLLVLIVASGVFAQERAANSRSNWISGELSMLGAGARYELMLGSNVSIGANVYFSILPIMSLILSEFGIDGVFRYYPWGKNFFVGAGLGFHTTTGFLIDPLDFYTHLRISGFAITPELGWKIDVGNEGGFYLQPGIRIPITIGEQSDTFPTPPKEFGIGVNVGFIPYFGMGFAF